MNPKSGKGRCSMNDDIKKALINSAIINRIIAPFVLAVAEVDDETWNNLFKSIGMVKGSEEFVKATQLYVAFIKGTRPQSLGDSVEEYLRNLKRSD